LQINGKDVSKLPHEQVVERIREAGDKVTMTVVTVSREDMDYSEDVMAGRQCATLPRKLSEFCHLFV
jgi:hypothetical protein